MWSWGGELVWSPFPTSMACSCGFGGPRVCHHGAPGRRNGGVPEHPPSGAFAMASVRTVRGKRLLSTSWPKRLISPSGLAFAVLCFLFPFFSLSCSGMAGDLRITYSGMSLAFGGTPSLDGSLASQLGSGDLEDLRVDANPLLLVSLVSLLVGVGLSAGLPNPLARSIGALASGGLALVTAGVNQIVMASSAEEEIASASGGQVAYADIQTSSGVGIVLLSFVLIAVMVWAVVDLVLIRRGPVPGGGAQGGPPRGPFPPPPRAAGPGRAGGRASLLRSSASGNGRSSTPARTSGAAWSSVGARRTSSGAPRRAARPPGPRRAALRGVRNPEPSERERGGSPITAARPFVRPPRVRGEGLRAFRPGPRPSVRRDRRRAGASTSW